ncbi:MAG: ABC transporter permease [Chitinophagaceae bacterium]
MPEKQIHWDWEIKKETNWLGASLKELYSYKDLLFRLVRKDFLASYQQTLLGPFWAVLQPIMTVLIYVLVFNKMMGATTDGFPPLLYYLTGITLWNLFSDIFIGTSVTFISNVYIFSKVYFPRIITPVSGMILYWIRFLIQLILLAAFLVYYALTGKITLHLNYVWLIIPIVIITSGISLGSGLIFSILTAKYRDLQNILQLVLRLLMFVCPLIYSLDIVPPKLKLLVMSNPLSSQFEAFRLAILGSGHVTELQFLYSAAMMIFLVAVGLLFFNKMGDKLIDVL